MSKKFINRKVWILTISFLLCIQMFSQSPVGAWERYFQDENGTEIRSVVIFSERFQSIAMFNAKSGEFIYSNGGTWELNGNMMTEVVEFDTANSERVGNVITFEVTITNDKLSLPESDWHFSRIDDGEPGELNGAWLMSGRYRNGEKETRNTDRPRKTMKILSGTRFQWIAFDNEKKELQSAAFERLINHLRDRKDVQNIDLMNLAGFCRNCLSKWYREEAEKKGIEITDPDAREHVYGMPYAEWKEKYQK